MSKMWFLPSRNLKRKKRSTQVIIADNKCHKHKYKIQCLYRERDD